jgi:hypothetical protein
VYFLYFLHICDFYGKKRGVFKIAAPFLGLWAVAHRPRLTALAGVLTRQRQF